MYEPDLVLVRREERDMKRVKRASVERFPMEEKRRFKLTVAVDDLADIQARDGTIHVWIDRGDVVNLQFDCSTMLLEDDLEQGEENALELSSRP